MTVKISNLPAATSVGSGDVLPVVQSGTTKKIDLNSPWSINIDGGNIDGTPIGVSSASSGAFTTLTASGNVGIGTTSPSDALDIEAATTVGLRLTSSSDGRALRFIGGHTGFDADRIIAGSTSLRFIDEGGNEMARLQDLQQQFFIGGNEAMRIDSSGTVLVGKTITAGAGAGIILQPDGRGVFTRDDNLPLQIRRETSDGDLIEFRKDTSTVGSIGTSGGDLTFGSGSSATERMRIDSSGRVGIGTTSPGNFLEINSFSDGVGIDIEQMGNSVDGVINFKRSGVTKAAIRTNQGGAYAKKGLSFYVNDAGDFVTEAEEAMRIDSSGNVLIGTTDNAPGLNDTNKGHAFGNNGSAFISTGSDGIRPLLVNRGQDGTIISLRSAGIEEGSISVSGTTVSYNGGHLSRWSRLPSGEQDASILKGTVMTNLDAMVEWGDEDNEQLNQMAISSVEGDPNVSGVFVNWDNDDDWNDMNIAMTGDMIIRIGAGVTVERGDLLMSAGDGTAKPQGDDVVKSKTIAKVTSTYVACTYDDGSYCVPCVLMAC